MKVITDLRQRHIEAYNVAIRESNVTPADISSPEWAGVVVRAAMAANMLEDLEYEDVGDYLPTEVVTAATEIYKAQTVALTFKKKPD